jgi:hypothetical protein
MKVLSKGIGFDNKHRFNHEKMKVFPRDKDLTMKK